LVAPGPAGPSNVVSALEEAEEIPPTEKELKKRKRLAAFRHEHSPFDVSAAKLHPVELEGRGRVLLDIGVEEHHDPTIPEPAPSKKKAGSRRRKKGGELSPKERKVLANTGSGGPLNRPNWPDAEFPWRLRTEERADLAKAEEAEKMRWIERFLDRDSDDEDGEENTTVRPDHDEVMPSAQWGVIYDDEVERPVPPKRGRGKMVPLIGDPSGTHTHIRKRNVFFPSDPADARAALLSKKSVRTLSYRQQKRRKQAEDEESDDEEVCICHGIDDGRELVQCDSCQTWYHLQCIGIRNIAELGREEDPWFCHACEDRNGFLSPEPEIVPRHPTLVPTDDSPRIGHSHDPPLFQPSLQDSPMGWNPSRIPKTPTRSGHEYEHQLSSGSTWIDSSRHGPSTPYYPSQSVRVYTSSTPVPFDGYNQYDESPFDPTSTPSRGIKFSAPFATPKNVWPSRHNGLFQTPSRVGGRSSSSRTFGGPGTLSSTLDDSGGNGGFWMSPLGRTILDDDSPVRRSKSGDGPKIRRVMDSPLASRSTGSLPPHLLEESPVTRFNSKDRLPDFA
jgi:PHD-finger